VRTTQPRIRNGFGALAYTDRAGDDCRLLAYDVASGISVELPPIKTNCQLWAPLKTSRIAYSTRTRPNESATSFRFLDLTHPLRPLGGRFQTSPNTVRADTVIWKSDGQRAAWCDYSHGRDYDIGTAVHELPRCPIAYTPSGRPAYSDGYNLIVGRRVVYRGDPYRGYLLDAHWGEDGSLAVALGFGSVDRIAPDGTTTTAVDAPFDLNFSPDNCAAFWAEGSVVHVLDLGCFDAGDIEFTGSAATWSPDGRWIAVAQEKQILFQQLIGGAESGTWPVQAAGLGWLR